eukprot:50303-Pleurochrysis_carterae.AAC.1
MSGIGGRCQRKPLHRARAHRCGWIAQSTCSRSPARRNTNAFAFSQQKSVRQPSLLRLLEARRANARMVEFGARAQGIVAHK